MAANDTLMHISLHVRKLSLFVNSLRMKYEFIDNVSSTDLEF